MLDTIGLYTTGGRASTVFSYEFIPASGIISKSTFDSPTRLAERVCFDEDLKCLFHIVSPHGGARLSDEVSNFNVKQIMLHVSIDRFLA